MASVLERQNGVELSDSDLADVVEILGRGIGIDAQGCLIEGFLAVCGEFGIGWQGGLGQHCRQGQKGVAQGSEAGRKVVGRLHLPANRNH